MLSRKILLCGAFTASLYANAHAQGPAFWSENNDFGRFRNIVEAYTRIDVCSENGRSTLSKQQLDQVAYRIQIFGAQKRFGDAKMNAAAEEYRRQIADELRAGRLTEAECAKARNYLADKLSDGEFWK